MRNMQDARNRERLLEMQTFISVGSSVLALPLFLLFWIADLIYTPDRWLECLLWRAAIIPICLITRILLKHSASTLLGTQLTALLFVFSQSLVIAILAVRADDPQLQYCAGLNLVAFGAVTFFPWTTRYLAAAMVAIYAPFYLLIAVSRVRYSASIIAIESFFVLATLAIAVTIRIYTERLRARELSARTRLEEELSSREVIIRERTEETLRLRALTRQFSPQIIDGIHRGRINLVNSIHDAEICTIFIDVVNSTERVRRIDLEHLNRAISMFMEDSMKVLLKYDITIDKFLGDGVLAFSNDPVARPDYVERVVEAALEVRARIKARADKYEMVHCPARTDRRSVEGPRGGCRRRCPAR